VATDSIDTEVETLEMRLHARAERDRADDIEAFLKLPIAQMAAHLRRPGRGLRSRPLASRALGDLRTPKSPRRSRASSPPPT
jgi:hypothetical protein